MQHRLQRTEIKLDGEESLELSLTSLEAEQVARQIDVNRDGALEETELKEQVTDRLADLRRSTSFGTSAISAESSMISISMESAPA